MGRTGKRPCQPAGASIVMGSLSRRAPVASMTAQPSGRYQRSRFHVPGREG